MRYWLELHWYSHYYFWENWHFYYCLLMQYVISLHLFQFCFLSFSNIYYLYCSFLCCSCTVTALQFLSLLWMEYFSIYKCYFFFFFWPCCAACGIIIPWPGIEPMPPAMAMQSLNHWTAREVPERAIISAEKSYWLEVFILNPADTFFQWVYRSYLPFL